MKRMTFDIVIVGGGAAGMFAAAVASDYGANILLFEKNEYLGRKLGITGKGRCNITNNCPVNEVIENIPNNGRFLYSAVNSFSPQDAIAAFERMGVKLKTERGNRVFPVSDKASEVVSALRRHILNRGVTIINEPVIDIKALPEKGFDVSSKNIKALCKKVIIATGGLSYSKTGSTGDGYSFAKKLGHTVTELRPSLVPLVEKGSDCAKMQGLSLRNVTLSIYNSKEKLVYDDFGEMLFTHFGLSGPLVLSASAHMRDFKNESYYAKIDLKPALDEKKLDTRILHDFEKFSNRDFENSLSELVHKKMIPVIVERSGIPGDIKVNSITKQQRANLLSVIKGFRVDILEPRPVEEAIITAGGINIKEINPSTMESKLVPGLYFAGEILDVDAYTGGFNLQIAWSTAYLAGCNAAINSFSEM